ncbi:hypothetical protein MUP06_00210 [Patescibacteria group bacterium]|nr:hypothetical protein [Patescibacteria group bacterium]
MEKQDLSKIIDRIEKLEKAVFGIHRTKKKKNQHPPPTDLDFSINERAFVKRYAVGKSGSRKFTLLVAYFANGEVDKEIELSDIRTHWNKMSAKNLLGKFNMFFTSDAKNNGWVNSKKYGSYCLTKEWKRVL